jgi:para-nitrobenzyl esterase
VPLYRFDWAPPAPGWPQYDLGAPHASELGFTMGNPEGWPELYGDAVPEGLMHQMMDAWIAFARTGDPNHSGMPTWAPYDVADHQTMIFDTTDAAPTSHLRRDVDGAERAFWNGVPFDGVVPAWAPNDLF